MTRRPLLLAGLLPLAALLPLQISRTPATQETETASPFPRYLTERSQGLEKQLDGAWTLLVFDTPEEQVDPQDFRGYAQFHDGYCTLLIVGAEDTASLFGPGTAYTFLSGAYRYRISDHGTLQLASVLGFDNLEEEGTLSFHNGPDATREYELSVDASALRLHEPGGDRFEFRRLPKSTFSDGDVRALDSLRQGFDWEEEGDG